MNTQNKWRFRGHRIRDKVQVVRYPNQHRLPILNPNHTPRSHLVCRVSEPIASIDDRIHELLNIFIDRLTRLEHYVYNTSERLKREKYGEEHLPSSEGLWDLTEQEKVREFREEVSTSSEPIRVRPKNRRGYYRDDPIESAGKPRTIDITQCRYCSS